MLMYLLHRYEGFFDQPKLFFALLVGLFGGLLVKFLEVQLFPFESDALVASFGPIYSLMYTVVGFALLEAAAKTAVLGLGRFRTRKDAPFHGTALGAAFGGMMSQLLVIRLLPMTDGHLRLDSSAWVQLGVLFVMSVGLILSHAASGAWVGQGSAQGRLIPGLLKAMAWSMPTMTFYWLFARGISPGPAAMATVLWGVFMVWQSQKRVLDLVVPLSLRLQVQRERRRRVRRGD